MLVCLLTSKLSWIPVSSTGMTPLGTGMTEEGGAAVLDEKAGFQCQLLS
ncbi:MAG: hypothetical protein ABS808_04005 [Wolbachia endosymbiont of Polyergus mexicanus]|uniref:Uncharacterized protein n=1 Tax=Wolbachia endosymbiont of Polyergus mexicanus TaxID=3171167 RepID=A0AAU7YJI4_9RICK